MSRKQLIVLFLYSIIHFTIGGARVPLLPVYLARLGVDPAVSGFYLALGFLSMAAGSLAAGWISDRFQRRRETLAIGALLALPMAYFMGQVNHIVPLTILTVLNYLVTGVLIAITNILAGMFAEVHERGRVFGSLAVGVSIGLMIGGFIGGTIVDRWGFATLFTVIALLYFVLMMVGLLAEDKIVVPASEHQPTASPPFMTRSLWVLFIGNVLQAAVGIGVGFSRPLAMNALGLSATSISSTSAIAALVTLPLPFVLGRASDRLGRKSVLIAGFACSIVGALILLFASTPWQFWLSAILLTVTGTVGGVATALVTDLTPPEAMGIAVSRFAATTWLGGSLGFTVSGLLIATMDIQTSFMVTVGIAAVATLLVSLIGTRKPIAVKLAT